MNTQPNLVPLLVVRDAVRAVDFYVQALGAKELVRYTHPTRSTITHANLVIAEGAPISVTEEARQWNSDSPPTLGGSPVVLQLHVDDVDAVFERMCALGAVVVFPLQEFAGERMGRVRDPFGHLWLIRQPLENLPREEVSGDGRRGGNVIQC